MPRLPVDAGYLLLSGSQTMAVQGFVSARGAPGGRGGFVDISTPQDIVITGPGGTAPPGALNLDSTLLSSYGADSLLVGGYRTFGTSTTTVTVRANNFTVDNAGAPLIGPEIILVANQTLALAPGAVIRQAGVLSDPADTLIFGDAAAAGSGDGALLRVSSDIAARIVRAGVTSSNIPNFTVGAGVSLSGGSLILDSTARMTLASTTTLDGDAISLDAGRISIQLDTPGALQPDAGLVLGGPLLGSVQSADLLSLLSYSSIDLYGTGGIGAGRLLALHTAEIRGFNNGGGTVTFAAPAISLDNSPGRPSPGPVAGLQGTLAFSADTVTIGANQVNIDQFSTVAMNAPGGILGQGSGRACRAGGFHRGGSAHHRCQGRYAIHHRGRGADSE